MSIRNTVGIIAALCAALGAGTSLAQASLPIERPTIKLGDAWTSRILDGWNNKETGQITHTVAGLEGNKVLVRSHSLPSDQTQTLTFTPDWQPCRSMQNSAELVCAGPLQFPLTDGHRHSYMKLPSGSGTTYYSGDCEGRGMEKVRVPAGEYDAVKMECKGTWTRVFGGSFTGQFDETVWYAPAVRNRVKQVFNTRRSNGTPDIKVIVELTEYKPAP